MFTVALSKLIFVDAQIIVPVLYEQSMERKIDSKCANLCIHVNKLVERKRRDRRRSKFINSLERIHRCLIEEILSGPLVGQR